MNPTNVLAIVSIVVAILVSSGAIAFVLRYHTRIALVERDSTKAVNKTEEHDKEIAATKERVLLMESTLNSIRDSLSKLHVVDRIAAAVDVLKERVEDNRKETAELRTDFRTFVQTSPPHRRAKK